MELAAPDSPEVVCSPGFEPEAGDLVVNKDRYSAFQGTGLADELRRRGIETVLVTGLTTAVCVSSTARDAFQLDFHTITLSDCCAEQNLVEHEAALETLGRVFGRVCASDEVVAAWQTWHTEHTTAAAERVEQVHESLIGPYEPRSAPGDGRPAAPQRTEERGESHVAERADLRSSFPAENPAWLRQQKGARYVLRGD